MVRQVAASTHIITGALSGSASAETGSQVFHQPSAVALDRSGRLYVLDQGTGTVRRFSQSRGAMVLVAGRPSTNGAYSGDNGPATQAQLNHPAGMALDRAGNLFIADTLNHRVRKLVSATGTIVTLAGSGTAGYSGDGGPAAAAQLSQPGGLAIDSEGNLYIADAAASVIRKVDARSGMISTVAGTGTAGFAGDQGPAIAAQLNSPRGVTVDTQGNLFIADTGNQRVRELAARNGIITTIAGNGSKGYSGDGGPSARAQLNKPYATAIDAAGNLYIADSGNGAVRKVRPDPQSSALAK
jgi:sugar lactone lactonase YvrE